MKAWAAALAGLMLAWAGRADACDRACLHAALDRYLAAIIAHDPAAAPLAKTYRETENAAETAPGAGVWASLTALGAVQRRYLDPVSGQAAYFGTVEEGVAAAIVSLRIKVEGRKIAEAEWIVARKGEALLNVAGLAAEPPPETIAPKAGRASRAQLRAAANSYFDGLQGHDGALVLHNPGCVRLENGTRVTGRHAPPPGSAAVEFDSGDCASNLDRMTQIDAVVHRRFPLIDEEAGVVLGTALFLRPPGGAKRADGSLWPRLLLAEYFRTEGGRISAIYAAMHYLPADAPETTGWPDQK
jgi:hypothetical protein